MKIYKSTLFTGVMSDCYEFMNVDFDSLDSISPINTIDFGLKIIGTAISKRKPTDIVNRMINILHRFCNKMELTFNIEELENGELCITVDETCYIFDISYLRIIIPVEYVTDYEIKEN